MNYLCGKHHHPLKQWYLMFKITLTLYSEHLIRSFQSFSCHSPTHINACYSPTHIIACYSPTHITRHEDAALKKRKKKVTVGIASSWIAMHVEPWAGHQEHLQQVPPMSGPQLKQNVIANISNQYLILIWHSFDYFILGFYGLTCVLVNDF